MSDHLLCPQQNVKRIQQIVYSTPANQAAKSFFYLLKYLLGILEIRKVSPLQEKLHVLDPLLYVLCLFDVFEKVGGVQPPLVRLDPMLVDLLQQKKTTGETLLVDPRLVFFGII
jgi:hypothetical protein